MKVVIPGALFFSGGMLVTQGWMLDLEGARFPDQVAERRAVLRTIFDFLTVNYAFSDPVIDPTEGSVPAEVERRTQDLIAMCRWSEQS